MDYLIDSYDGADDPQNYAVEHETTAQDKRDTDDNGWFEVKDNPLSKEGVFLYRGNQITLPDGSKPPDPDELYPVYRPADELSDKEAIDSFKLVPWVDDHAMLGKEELGMMPAEKKGVCGVIGQDVYFKDGTLYGNIKAFSEALARRIENGKKDLSLGYRCRYEHSPGVWNGKKYDYIQRNLRGNHLALVTNGRMGAEVQVLDHDDSNIGQFNFTCDSQMEKKEMDKTNEAPVGADSGVTLEALVEQLKQVVSGIAELKEQQGAEVEEEIQDSEAENEAPAGISGEESEDEDKSRSDPLDKILDMLESISDRLNAVEAKVNGSSEDEDETEQEQSETMDAADIAKNTMQQIATRDKLYSKVSAFTGAFDCSAMDAQDVAVYGCRKLGIKANKGQEMAMLQGYMLNRTPTSQKRAVAMDSAGGKGSFLDKQLTK
ncbi:DUF2213 domain-containing protein [Testudinibacter sp. P80/BLE/0925]